MEDWKEFPKPHTHYHSIKTTTLDLDIAHGRRRSTKYECRSFSKEGFRNIIPCFPWRINVGISFGRRKIPRSNSGSWILHELWLKKSVRRARKDTVIKPGRTKMCTAVENSLLEALKTSNDSDTTWQPLKASGERSRPK